MISEKKNDKNECGALEAYIAAHDDARVAATYKTQDGVTLGSWVNNQRQAYKKDQLPQDRIARLEALPGWVWDPHDQQWEENFSALEVYIAEHGDARVANRHKTQDGVTLGSWVATQRQAYKKDQLPQERITRLEALSGWVWSIKE